MKALVPGEVRCMHHSAQTYRLFYLPAQLWFFPNLGLSCGHHRRDLYSLTLQIPAQPFDTILSAPYVIYPFIILLLLYILHPPPLFYVLTISLVFSI